MELYVLQARYFTPLAVIDTYKSLIWTKRYYTCGDFELYLPADARLLSVLQVDNCLQRDDDDTIMIIENIEITTSTDKGDFFIITGRSLESLLARRIIWGQTNLSYQNPVEGIFKLVQDNAISPDNVSRIIPGLSLGTAITVDGPLAAQFTGANLLDTVTSICNRYEIGMKILLYGVSLVFVCYKGQEVDVTFSPEFDNLISSDYTYNSASYLNCGLTAGEGEGTSRRTAAVWTTADEPEGLQRREMYIDARDVSSNGGSIPDATYMANLTQRGKEKLAEQDVIVGFENEIAPNMTYRYKVDYNLGDIVTLSNSYGVTTNPRITAIIESWNDEGYKVIPTFEKQEVDI